MPINFAAEFLTTVGVEIESEMIPRGRLTDALVSKLGVIYENRLPLEVSRDASAETIMEMVRLPGDGRQYLALNSHNNFVRANFGRRNPSTYGYELILNPMSITELKPLLFRLENLLQDLGDGITDRCAVHFHVGFAHNLRFMKKLLAVCLRIDPLLFRLGGFGRMFRGHSNLSAYARPLLNAAAVPVKAPRRTSEMISIDDDHIDEQDRRESPRVLPNRFVQVINPMAALQATTLKEFWACFGVLPEVHGIPKYHPARYTACNFYAILAHGTMEFRHFNQTLDADAIFTTAKFLRAVVDLSTQLSKPDLVYFPVTDSNQQIDMEAVANIMWTFEKLFHQYEVEDAPTTEELALLTGIIEKSSVAPIPETPVRTHIRDFALPANFVEKLVEVKAPLSPQHIDIHTLENRNYSILRGDIA